MMTHWCKSRASIWLYVVTQMTQKIPLLILDNLKCQFEKKLNGQQRCNLSLAEYPQAMVEHCLTKFFSPVFRQNIK